MTGPLSQAVRTGSISRSAQQTGLVDDRLVDKLLDEPPVERPLGARSLGHQDADELLLRVDPEAMDAAG